MIGKLLFGAAISKAINAAKGAAEGAIEEAGTQKLSDFKKVTVGAISDTVESMIGGRRTLEEWCEIASQPVDAIVAKSVSEEGLQFVGGYLCFSFADTSKKKVIIGYELYFLNEQKQWIKQDAHSDVYANNFTAEALEEIANKGTVKFNVDE